MNNPEYILVDELGLCINNPGEPDFRSVSIDIGTPIYYRYGYLKELNNWLNSVNGDPEGQNKYPMVWVMQPFTIVRGVTPSIYGRVNDLRIFIMNESKKDSLAEERMADNFKPIIYPIYRSLLQNICLSPAFSTDVPENISHNVIDRYWIKDLGLDDTIDCIELRISDLGINNNYNCTPSKLV